MGWTVSDCTATFRHLLHEAFSLREALQHLLITPFRNVAQIFCSFRYKSNGIERALTNAFDRGPLFGRSATTSPDLVNVAVVATKQENFKYVLITNYNRNQTEGNKLAHIKWIQGRTASRRHHT